ncbi:DUF4235 domain-containing protein [Gordonia alkaliphila]|uniref:DUF4235 domain-containing protein n=1 Tax=Gordonia alkaliphila TaxID=1053547 RepID=UPI001FF5E6DF|nr:DUF4235 domain-containing protein [Gordonia alkaliphila]MCK0438188.1 DUF4235 domain-containing protein [Gordonia alkaliphila]
MGAVTTTMYKPLSLATSVVGGMLAGAAFSRVWGRFNDDDSVPDPKDLRRSKREVLIAAAVQGLIFGVVKAAVDRAGAQGFRKLTASNPPVS